MADVQFEIDKRVEMWSLNQRWPQLQGTGLWEPKVGGPRDLSQESPLGGWLLRAGCGVGLTPWVRWRLLEAAPSCRSVSFWSLPQVI